MARVYAGVARVKVIERSGPTMAEWKQEVDCIGCASRLQVDATDLLEVDETNRRVWRFTCPLCDGCNTVELPVTVAVELQRTRRIRSDK